MRDDNFTRIDLLRRRQNELREKIAAEQEKHRKREARDTAREFSAIGEALCKHAVASPDFRLMLKELLDSAVSDPAARKFLGNRGWL